MTDQATNRDGDSGRFKILNEWEHDDPAQAPTFKRDQHLTPEALMKGKVLALLRDALDGDSPSDYVVSDLIRRVEAIQP